MIFMLNKLYKFLPHIYIYIYMCVYIYILVNDFYVEQIIQNFTTKQKQEEEKKFF